MAGDVLTDIEMNGGFASYDYNRLFYSHKNTVGRFLFCGEHANKGEISFYIPDENWLNNALQIKKQRDESTTLTDTASLQLSDSAKAYVKTLAELTNEVNKIKNGENQKFNNAIDNFIGKAVRGEHKVRFSTTTLLFEGQEFQNEHPIDVYAMSWLFIRKGEKKNDIQGPLFKEQIILPLKNAFMENIDNPKYLSDMNIFETAYKDTSGVKKVR